MRIPDHHRIEETLGSLFVSLSVLYDNVQVFSLTYLVSKRHGKKNANETEIQLRKTMIVNVLVCMLDWITLMIFVTQVILPKNPTSYVLQQVAVAHTGIHASLLVVVFQRLKKLTFAGRKVPLVAVPAPKAVKVSAHDTELG
jgi:Na+-driven multidrug efflux pump